MANIFEKNKKIILAFVTLILLTLSGLYMKYTWDTSIKTTSDQALTTGRIAAATLSEDALNQLTIESSDTDKKEYQYIKSSLMAIKNINTKIRFAYIYAQRAGKIYFAADSESVSSSDYSPPGQEYPEADAEDVLPFTTRQAIVTKPAADRWGTWVSVLVPIEDPTTNKVIGVFGLDYPASDWNDVAVASTAQAGVIAFGFIGLLFAFYRVSTSNMQTIENERNYRTFFESIDDSIIVASKDGKILYTNSSLTKKLGYSEKEIKQMHVLELNPKNKRKEAERIFGDMLTGKTKTCPLPLERKDGSLIPAETQVWFGKWNGQNCVFAVSKDLGEEQELLEKFNKRFNNNPSLMAISSLPDQKFTDVNEAFLTKIGYAKDEVIGKTSHDLHLFMNESEQKNVSEELKNRGNIHDIPLQIKTKTGAIIEGLFSGEIIENQGKSYFLTVMIDQTESKHAQEEMEKMNEELRSVNKLMVDREMKMVELKKELEKCRGTASVSTIG